MSAGGTHFPLRETVKRGALRGRALVARLRREPDLLLVEGDTYAATAVALADAYRSVRAGGRIAVLNASDGSDARCAVDGFRFEHGVLPVRETTAGTVEIDVPTPKDPATHFARALREKWREVPVSRSVRAFSEDLARLEDVELLNRWEQHRRETSSPDVRGWYQTKYRDELRGKRVLDFGCGFGVDGIFFAENGADVSFADIVGSNLEILGRVAKKRGLSIQTHFIEDFFDYSFEEPFDVILAIGSLINAPLTFTQRQLDSLLRWHSPGGTFLLLGYPRERFEELGVRNGHEFGMLTDGERTPWCEWLDRERVEQLFGSQYEVVFERSFGVGGTEFNWFELRRCAE
ncbi:MAG: class I SAM-dependent methyltransferase [Actinobacteria bacterium]|nr:class I SAM-dependent methyltransferase [Actinomycetota bacterium]